MSGSDAEVRRVFQRLVISFLLEFFQANLLGKKAITTYGKINPWGVNCCPVSGLKNKAKTEKIQLLVFKIKDGLAQLLLIQH